MTSLDLAEPLVFGISRTDYQTLPQSEVPNSTIPTTKTIGSVLTHSSILVLTCRSLELGTGSNSILLRSWNIELNFVNVALYIKSICHALCEEISTVNKVYFY